MNRQELEEVIREELARAHRLPVMVIDDKGRVNGMNFRRVPHIGEHVEVPWRGGAGGLVTNVLNIPVPEVEGSVAVIWVK